MSFISFFHKRRVHFGRSSYLRFRSLLAGVGWGTESYRSVQAGVKVAKRSMETMKPTAWHQLTTSRFW